MRIGVLSDTHNNMKSVECIVEIFAKSRVERIVHTGDITQAKVLDALSELNAEIHGVYGNNDIGEKPGLEKAAERNGMSFHDGPLELEWAGRKIVVVHDPRDLETLPDPNWDLALHGHTHLRTETRHGEQLIFNPGECAGHLQGHNATQGTLSSSVEDLLLSDWYYEPERVRSIHADVRYMLWVMDRVDGAHELLREMGIEPSFAGK